MFNDTEFNKAYRYCLSLTKDREEASELLQSGFEKFLKKDGFKADNPKNYLYRVLRNHFIDE